MPASLSGGGFQTRSCRSLTPTASQQLIIEGDRSDGIHLDRALSASAGSARRQDRLQRAEAAFDPLAFDTAAARAYGLIYAAVIAQGRKARGARAVDLLIAAVAAAHGIPLVTRNPEDFSGLAGIVTVVEV